MQRAWLRIYLTVVSPTSYAWIGQCEERHAQSSRRVPLLKPTYERDKTCVEWRGHSATSYDLDAAGRRRRLCPGLQFWLRPIGRVASWSRNWISHDEIDDQRRREVVRRAGRHAVALGASRHSRHDGHEIWLRHCPMWRVYGAYRWQAGTFLQFSRRHRG